EAVSQDALWRPSEAQRAAGQNACHGDARHSARGGGRLSGTAWRHGPERPTVPERRELDQLSMLCYDAVRVLPESGFSSLRGTSFPGRFYIPRANFSIKRDADSDAKNL